MAGYRTINQINALTKECDLLGLEMGYPIHGGYVREYGDVVALHPKGKDGVPGYARDAELFVGTLDDLERFIQGINWARNYDRMLGVSNEKKRQRKEQDELNRQLISALKQQDIAV